MAVIYSADQLARIKSVVGTVETVGQAQAAVVATLKMASDADESIGQWLFEDAWRTQARKDIADKVIRLQSQARQIITSGSLSSPVGAVWKSQLQGTCTDLWLYALLVAQEFPPDESSAAERFGQMLNRAGDALVYGIQQAPKLLVESAGAAVRAVVDPALDQSRRLAGDLGESLADILNKLLGPLKWYLIGGVVILVGGGVAFVVAKKKGMI